MSGMSVIASKDELIERLERSAESIRGYGVKRLALFGSFSRSESSDTSDVDLLVEFEAGTKSFDRFLDLADFLDGLLQRHVDLVTLESLSPHLGPAILAQAQDVRLGR